MTIEEVLDLTYPFTAEIKKCRVELQKQQHRRNELRKIIELRQKGTAYKSPMVLSIDLDAIWRMINN